MRSLYNFRSSVFVFNATEVGGPDRPIPEKPRDREGTEDAAMSAEAGVASTAGAAAASLAASAAAAQANIYNRLTSALGERGYASRPYLASSITQLCEDNC